MRISTVKGMNETQHDVFPIGWQAVEKTVEDIAEKQSPSQCVLPETSDSLKAFQTNPQKIEKLLQISPQRCCPTIAVSDR
jgi:hypothetical protein